MGNLCKKNNPRVFSKQPSEIILAIYKNDVDFEFTEEDTRLHIQAVKGT